MEIPTILTRNYSVMKTWIEKWYHLPYNMASKYIPGLIILMISITLANKDSVPRHIKCKYLRPNELEMGTTGRQYELKNWCWYSRTFILNPDINHRSFENVTYADIARYYPGRDQILIQRYYRDLAICLCLLFCIAYAPLYCNGNYLRPSNNAARRVTATKQFVTDFERTFSTGLISTSVQFILTLTAFGEMLLYTGFNYTIYTIDIGDEWPNPMDTVSPKVTVCDTFKYREHVFDVRLGICKLPNFFTDTATRCIFVIYWWALFSSLVLNTFYLFIYCFLKIYFIVYPNGQNENNNRNPTR